MRKIKANNYIKSLLQASGYFYTVSGIKSVELFDLPPFKEFYHRHIYKIDTKDNHSYELMLETVDAAGVFSENSAVLALRSSKQTK